VRPFRRGASYAIDRVDAKLMGLGVPSLRALELIPQGPQPKYQLLPNLSPTQGRVNGLEHSLKTSMQGVVVQRLPVRAVRHQMGQAFFYQQTVMAALPVAA
jgi:hypothetical protein